MISPDTRYPIPAVNEANVNLRLFVQLLIVLWLWPVAGMADLEAGLAAYEWGDYDTASTTGEKGERPCAVQTGHHVR